MGHVEPGGETTDELWETWRRLKAFFPTWNLIPSSFYTPGAWGYFGVDFVSGFRRNRSTKQAFELLCEADGARFDAISAIANLNSRRQDQMLRAVVIAYLRSRCRSSPYWPKSRATASCPSSEVIWR